MEIMTGYEKLGQNHLRQISYRDSFARMMGYHFLHFHLTYLRDFAQLHMYLTRQEHGKLGIMKPSAVVFVRKFNAADAWSRMTVVQFSAVEGRRWWVSRPRLQGC